MKNLRRQSVQFLPLAFAASVLACSAWAGDSPAAVDFPGAPVNCSVQVAVIRCSSKNPVAPEKLRDCRRAADVWQVLGKSGAADLLYRSTRTVCCDGQCAVDFTALESRPVVCLGAGEATNVSHEYGTAVHLQITAAGAAAGRPVFLVGWDGSWAGSPQLMSKWESLAVRGFNAASKIPGIMYQKTEEDDDGFISTGSGTDISSFFKKKSKAKPSDADTKPAPAEPDYLDDATFENVALQGQAVTSPGGLIITRQRLPSTDSVEELFFIISM